MIDNIEKLLKTDGIPVPEGYRVVNIDGKLKAFPQIKSGDILKLKDGTLVYVWFTPFQEVLYDSVYGKAYLKPGDDSITFNSIDFELTDSVFATEPEKERFMSLVEDAGFSPDLKWKPKPGDTWWRVIIEGDIVKPVKTNEILPEDQKHFFRTEEDASRVAKNLQKSLNSELNIKLY